MAAVRSGHAGDARGEVLLSRAEAVAEAHSAHAQLFDLCEYAADRGRLCQHMRAGTPHNLDTLLLFHPHEPMTAVGHKGRMPPEQQCQRSPALLQWTGSRLSTK